MQGEVCGAFNLAFKIGDALVTLELGTLAKTGLLYQKNAGA